MAYIRKRGKSYEYTVSKTVNGKSQRISKMWIPHKKAGTDRSRWTWSTNSKGTKPSFKESHSSLKEQMLPYKYKPSN